MTAVCPFDSNLCPSGMPRARGWKDFENDSSHCGTWFFPDPLHVEILRHYSCGPGRARLRHFDGDTSARRLRRCFLAFSMWHSPIIGSRSECRSPIPHTCGESRQFLSETSVCKIEQTRWMAELIITCN